MSASMLAAVALPFLVGALVNLIGAALTGNRAWRERPPAEEGPHGY